MDENNRVDSEKRSSHPPPPSAKRIKKVLKRNERREKEKSINRSRYEDDLSPFRDPPAFRHFASSNFPYYEGEIDRKNFDSYIYIYIHIRKTNKFPRGCLKHLKG